MICTSCKASVPNDYAYCLECGQYLGEPTVVFPTAEPTLLASQSPASASSEAPTKSSTGNRLPWLITGVSVAILLTVLLLGAAHFFFKNDQQIPQASASPSPASVVSQVSVAGPTPSTAPTKKERPHPTVVPSPSPPAPSVANEPATAPRIDADGPNKIYSGDDVSSKARIVSKPQPSYTEEARQNQVTGTVVLRAVFTSTGEVRNITARSGLPNGLTERAIQAARQIKFVPATKDGRPVSMYIQLEYNFNLY